MNLPVEFENNMKNLLKGDYDSYINCLQENAKRGFRVNQNYVKIEDFERFFDYPYEKISGFRGYYKLLTEEKLGNTIFHHLGMIYLQEPSSMLAAMCLDVKEGDSVLDLCSAPGGKGSQIIEKNKTGEVVLNEVVRKRANVLLSNVERQGFKNAIITSLNPSILSKYLPNHFDKILVDAPCSGEGMFRKEPETILEWNKGLPEYNHLRQMEILEEADKMLKEGGTLVYSTCTFNVEENERTVFEFVHKFGYEIVPVDSFVQEKTTEGYKYNQDKNLMLTRRCFPQGGFGEGQFIAKMIKKSANNCEKSAKYSKNALISRVDMKIVNSFIEETMSDKPSKLYQLGENIFIYDKEFKVFDGIVSLGVNLGRIEKGRLIPHHQLFKAYGNSFKNKLKLDLKDERVGKYIQGNEIECDRGLKGYVSVFAGGVPLGGGKADGMGRLKNLYPKGLRGELKSKDGN